MDFKVDCLVNDWEFSYNSHRNPLFKCLSKEISTNENPDLVKLKTTITGGKKCIPFIPILTKKVQTRVLGNEDGFKQKKAIDANSTVNTLDNKYMDMAVKVSMLSPSHCQ